MYLQGTAVIEDNNIDDHDVFVPANCIGELQPMDLSMNKSVKDFYGLHFKNGIPQKYSKTIKVLLHRLSQQNSL